MKKAALVLTKIAYVIGAVFLLILAYNTAHYTFSYNLADLEDSGVYECPDSRGINLIVIVLAFLAAFAVSKLIFIKAADKEKKEKRAFIFSACVSAVMFVLMCLWVGNTHIPPYWDQAYVYQAASEFITGDYGFMKNYIYLTMYPHQLGLIFFESLFLRIWNDYGMKKSLRSTGL